MRVRVREWHGDVSEQAVLHSSIAHSGAQAADTTTVSVTTDVGSSGSDFLVYPKHGLLHQAGPSGLRATGAALLQRADPPPSCPAFSLRQGSGPGPELPKAGLTPRRC